MENQIPKFPLPKPTGKRRDYKTLKVITLSDGKISEELMALGKKVSRSGSASVEKAMEVMAL